MAVARIDASKFWAYSQVLFDHQAQFFDLEVWDKSRETINQELADLATKVGIDKAVFLALVSRIPSAKFSNTGNEITNEFKVSPTCFRCSAFFSN